MKTIQEHKKAKRKKSVTAQVINIFILVLIISVLSGMTFLFVSQLKEEVRTTATGGINSTAYQAVNKTEQAGYNVTKYLTLLFLALIFGAILIVVLRVMLPYINVGRQMSGGF
jgi:ABC-type multidrug transport system permease subunit